MGAKHTKEPNKARDYGIPPTGVYNKHTDGSTTTPFKINVHQRARVDKIHIDGLVRTKDDIVKAQVTDLFKAKDFVEVVEHANKVKNKLEDLGCFKKIGITIDTSKGPEASPSGVEVTFNVQEMKRLSGSINTMVGNDEGSVSFEARAPNIFGRGERLQINCSHGNKSSSNINISAVKPFVSGWLHKVLTTTVFTSSTDAPWSGYKQKDYGILLDLAVTPGALKHNFQYEATYRNIIAAKQAAFSVREQCGPNLKSALRHICSIDKRDDIIFPTSGSNVQFTTEFAGLGGDIGFMKYEFMLQSNWTPHEFFTFQLGAQAGFLRGISNDMQINIADNFFLGGPMNVRGFTRAGCGPQRDGNALGGNTFWALGLHLYTPLPFRPGKGGFGDHFKLHGFVNGGNVDNLSFSKDGDYSGCMKIFTDNVRWSTGAGIAMRLGGIARIELNLVMPLLKARTDLFSPYQFGIGVHYL